MARKARTQVVAEKAKEVVSISDGSVEMDRVLFRKLESRRLMTVGPDHPVWGMSVEEMVVANVEGALVRLEPPAGVTDATLDALENELLLDGAVAVRVGHRQRADAVIPQVEKEQPATKGESTHQVVMNMVEEAKVGNKEALRDLIEAALAAEGL